MGTAAVVLLCAEEDDLELVRWVHAARGQGLAPEVVTGIEHDDGPLLDALGQTEEALFVVLRSDNLSADRMREIKNAFARHHRSTQRLVALRLDATAEAAVERIAKQIAGGLGGRSETSLTLALEDVVLQRVRQGTGSHPAIVASRKARAESEQRSTTARVAEVAAAAVTSEPAAPSVGTALAWANVENERATTQRYSIDDETLPLPIIEASAQRASRVGAMRTPALLGGVVIALASAVAIAWWLIAATAPGERVPDDAVPPASNGRVTVPTAAAIEAPREEATVDPSVRIVVPQSERDREPARVAGPRRTRQRSTVGKELPPPPIVAAPAEGPSEPLAAAQPAAVQDEGDGIPSEPAPLESDEPVATR